MGLADWALKVGLAQMDPDPEPAHPNAPKPRPEASKPPKEANR